MKFSNRDFFSKYEQINSFLRIWSYLLKKSLLGNFIFCTVLITSRGGLEFGIGLDFLEYKILFWYGMKSDCRN